MIRTHWTGDVAHALGTLASFNWSSLLATHLKTHDADHLFDDLTEGRYRLVYTRAPSAVFSQEAYGELNLSYSLRAQRSGGRPRLLRRVRRANLSGEGRAADADRNGGRAVVRHEGLAEAVSQSAEVPVTLGLRMDGVAQTVTVPYRGTLRYQHLERIPGTEDRQGTFLMGRR